MPSLFYKNQPHFEDEGLEKIKRIFARGPQMNPMGSMGEEELSMNPQSQATTLRQGADDRDTTKPEVTASDLPQEDRPQRPKTGLFQKIVGIGAPALLGLASGVGAAPGAALGYGAMKNREQEDYAQDLGQYNKEQALNKEPDTLRLFNAYRGMSPKDQALYEKFKEANTTNPFAALNYQLSLDKFNHSKVEHDEDQARKVSEFQDKNVQKLQDKLGNSQDAVNTLGEVEGQLGFNLDEYDPKTNTAKNKKVDLPGVSVPGVGRVSFYDKDARNLEDTAQKLFNIQVKDRSGASVTSNEMQRIQKEWSQGKYNTEADRLNAMQRYKRALQQTMKDVEAGFNPSVVGELESRGGVTSKRLANKNQEAIDWANANPNDPRSAKILQKLGVK